VIIPIAELGCIVNRDPSFNLSSVYRRTSSMPSDLSMSMKVQDVPTLLSLTFRSGLRLPKCGGGGATQTCIDHAVRPNLIGWH
jgi:hypothetical protein